MALLDLRITCFFLRVNEKKSSFEDPGGKSVVLRSPPDDDFPPALSLASSILLRFLARVDGCN